MDDELRFRLRMVPVGVWVTYALFLTLTFAALSYPLASVVGVCGMNLVAFILVFCVREDIVPVTPGVSHLWMFTLTLTLAGAMCGWQTRMQGAVRRELARLSRAGSARPSSCSTSTASRTSTTRRATRPA